MIKKIIKRTVWVETTLEDLLEVQSYVLAKGKKWYPVVKKIIEE